ncbi:hypothetical protein Scep_009387 [Stephania cephalantha]|uniref:Uncharacterized protein n=1 Tax=Stephania cephalantha TaxID=152367 RepID=A0AAP0PG79_9MAGN
MMECTEIEAASEALEKSVIFHVVKEMIGFVLYMHQQIPSILQDLNLEFDAMRIERNDLESGLKQGEAKASIRRKLSGRMRESKKGMRKLEKLMNSIASIHDALQQMLEEVHGVQGVVLLLGSSPLQPRHVYELSFSQGNVASESEIECTKNKAAEALSRKIIRTLISNGAGSVSYAGPMKLFLLVKAPASFTLPQHFLPKREFRYKKKTVPFRLHIKCKVRNQIMENSLQPFQSSTFSESESNEIIWFQCRHTIKGLACKSSFSEE